MHDIIVVPYNSVTATGAVLQMMNTDHCYYLKVSTSSDVMLHLLQPHPPMSPEAIQLSVDHQIHLVKALQQWWKEECGNKVISGVLCPICKDQPHPLEDQPHLLDHLQCKGQPVSLSEHTKLIMNSSEYFNSYNALNH